MRLDVREVYSEKSGNLLIAFEKTGGRPVCIVTLDAKTYPNRDHTLYEEYLERLTDSIKDLYSEIN